MSDSNDETLCNPAQEDVRASLVPYWSPPVAVHPDQIPRVGATSVT
jgi:hypothetical protein